MILKIQKPLGGNMEPMAALAYNEDRSVEMFIPYDEELAELFGDDVKQYWEAKLGIQPGGQHYIAEQLTLMERVEYPGW